MMPLTDISGLAGISFALASLLVPLAAPHAKGQSAWPYLAACIALALIPFDGPSVAVYLRGAFGDLSFASLLLLSLRLVRQRDASAPSILLPAFIAFGALALYPFALGVGLFDPYRAGFGSPAFLAILLTIALISWHRGQHQIALWLALSVLAWNLGWYESVNLWDYLVDPWAALYSFGALVRLAVASLQKRMQHSG